MDSAEHQWLNQLGGVLETLNQGVIINDENKTVVFAGLQFPWRNARNRWSGTHHRARANAASCENERTHSERRGGLAQWARD